MDKLSIGVVSTHSFPIGLRGPVTHTGDVVIMDLVRSLSEMGHDVSFFTPDGGYKPPNVKIYPMRASLGSYPPSSISCENECFDNNSSILRNLDIIHDFSVTKGITKRLNNEGRKNTLCTLMGGPWTDVTSQPHNLVVWSQSHRHRVLNGFTDYHQTPLDGLAGPNQPPLQKDAHVVNGGVDTDFYCPSYDKKNYLLWLNRWHPAKNYKLAIELARMNSNIEVVMSGEHPDNELFEYQRNCALEAVELAKGLGNVHFEFLPRDPDHHVAKRKLYQEAKGLLNFSTFSEPWGLSQCENLASGSSVIGLNYGSTPEVIKNGTTGYICDDNNLESIAISVSNLDKIEPTTCRDEAVKRFDRKVMAQNYLNEYTKIINGESW